MYGDKQVHVDQAERDAPIQEKLEKTAEVIAIRLASVEVEISSLHYDLGVPLKPAESCSRAETDDSGLLPRMLGFLLIVEDRLTDAQSALVHLRGRIVG